MASPTLPRRVFAVIPAAGLSSRMGRPKLLLQIGGESVIRRLVAALTAGGVDEIHCLARADDAALQAELAGIGVTVHVTLLPTPDMRSSVERLLHAIALTREPADADAWLLCPADHPVLNPEPIRGLLLAATETPDRIIVPTCHGRRGHPTLFPWPLAREVPAIPENLGLNTLLKARPERIRELPVEDESVLCDLDTPQDYERLLRIEI